MRTLLRVIFKHYANGGEWIKLKSIWRAIKFTFGLYGTVFSIGIEMGIIVFVLWNYGFSVYCLEDRLNYEFHKSIHTI